MSKLWKVLVSGKVKGDIKIKLYPIYAPHEDQAIELARSMASHKGWRHVICEADLYTKGSE